MRGLFDSRKTFEGVGVFLFQGGRVHMRDLPKHDVKGGLNLKKMNCMLVFSVSQFSKIVCYMILIELSDVFIII